MSNPHNRCASVLALSLSIAFATQAFATGDAAYTLQGDYIKIGTNSYGTLGSIGNTSPGIQYDNTGTGTFNDNYDYLTPGSPFEGFAITASNGGTTHTTTSNNDGGMGLGISMTSFSNTSSGSQKSVVWQGSFTPTNGSKLYDVENTVSFTQTGKQVKITSKITATQDLTGLKFARFTDPDAQAAAGDTSITNNVRGNGSVSANQLVYAEALASKYVIGLYSTTTTGVNTGVSPEWSTDPSFYVNFSGSNTEGDDVVGIGFDGGSLLTGQSITFTYYYIFGSDISAALGAAGAGKSVLASAQVMSNSPSFAGAAIIDNTPALKTLFDSLNTDQAVSNAASQTLPLLTGGSQQALSNTFTGINNAIEGRLNGKSAGDGFVTDKYVWVKPFGSWADQKDQNGVSGYKTDTTGLVVGADGKLNDKVRLGVAAAYAKSDVDGNSSVAKQSAKIDVFQLVGYGSYALGNNAELNFQADVGQNVTKGQRTIAFTSTVASADYDSLTAHLGASVGRSYQLGAKTTLTPSLRADYTWIKDAAYNETGAGLLNLNVASRDSESMVFGIDSKLAHQLNDTTTLDASVGVGYDSLAKRSSITAAFAGAPGAAFTTYGIDPDPWTVRAGLGLTHTTAKGTEISVRYDAEHREGNMNQTASVKARWAF